MRTGDTDKEKRTTQRKETKTHSKQYMAESCCTMAVWNVMNETVAADKAVNGTVMKIFPLH